MTIDAVTAPATTGMYSSSVARAPKQTMDSEVFMSLLVTQLRNQDPSSPMDTNQMIAQTTQLAMMEKLNSLATTNEENFSLQMRMAAASLVGQDVTFTDADGKEATGQATAVSYAGAVPQVTVNGQTIALDAISGIAARAVTAASDAASA